MIKPFKDPRTGVYYFRRIVPNSLRNIIHKSEVKISLRTKNYSDALVNFHQEASYCEKLFNNAKNDGKVILTNKRIKEIAGKWLSSKIIDDDTERSVCNPEHDYISNSNFLMTLHGCLDGNDFSLVENDTNFVIHTNGLPIYKRDKEYQTLAKEMLIATILLYQVIDKRGAGDYSDKLEDVLVTYPGNDIDMTLHDLFCLYVQQSNKPENTIATYKNAVKLFVELHPQSNASSINKPMVRDYRDNLLMIPRLRSNLSHMNLMELVKYSSINKIEDLISPATVNKNIKYISAVLSWAESNGYFDNVPNWSNPANGIRADDSNKSPRLPFDESDIKAIFNKDYNSLTNSKYWIPLISLYSGARLEEIGQLSVSDIKEDREFGFWYMDINENEKGRRLKNKSATRLVPIHNKIIELGFIDYLDSSGRVFKDLNRKSKDDKLTPKVSKWFSRYKRDKGITSTQKTFHSFRHLFKDAVRSQISNEELSDAITGHTNPSIGRKYGLGYGLEKLNKGVQSLRFDITDIIRYDSRR